MFECDTILGGRHCKSHEIAFRQIPNAAPKLASNAQALVHCKTRCLKQGGVQITVQSAFYYVLAFLAASAASFCRASLARIFFRPFLLCLLANRMFRTNLASTPRMEGLFPFLGLLMPFLWSLRFWLWLVWFLVFAMAALQHGNRIFSRIWSKRQPRPQPKVAVVLLLKWHYDTT